MLLPAPGSACRWSTPPSAVPHSLADGSHQQCSTTLNVNLSWTPTCCPSECLLQAHQKNARRSRPDRRFPFLLFPLFSPFGAQSPTSSTTDSNHRGTGSRTRAETEDPQPRVRVRTPCLAGPTPSLRLSRRLIRSSETQASDQHPLAESVHVGADPLDSNEPAIAACVIEQLALVFADPDVSYFATTRSIEATVG